MNFMDSVYCEVTAEETTVSKCLPFTQKLSTALDIWDLSHVLYQPSSPIWLNQLNNLIQTNLSLDTLVTVVKLFNVVIKTL